MTLGVEYAGKEGKSVETRERSAFRRLTIRQAFSISHFAKPLQTCFVKFSRFSVQNIAGRLINPADCLIARGSNREGRPAAGRTARRSVPASLVGGVQMQKTSGMFHQPSWQHIRGLECISPMLSQAENLQRTSEYGNDRFFRGIRRNGPPIGGTRLGTIFL